MIRDEELDRLIRGGASAWPPAGSCVAPEQLVAFYQGALAEADEEAVRAHIASCGACVEAARDARRFVQAMEARRGSASPARVNRWLAIAATLAGVGLLGAIYFGFRPAGPTPAEIARSISVAPAPYVAGPDELVWRGGGSTLDLAVQRYHDGDYSGAARAFADHVAARPHDARARFYLGVSRLLSGSPVQAADDLEAAQALAGCPEDAGWYLALARLKAGELTEARRALAELSRAEGPHREEARGLLRRLGPERAP